MTVAEFIEVLKKYPSDLPVVYGIYSESCLLEEKDIIIEDACLPRKDGWVANKRPDQPLQKYLMLPGN